METDKEKERRKISLRRVVSHELFLLFLTLLVIGFVLYNLAGLWHLLRTP